MSSFRNLDVQLAQSEGLQHAIQIELANRDYSSEDDPVMAEYIVVMLANQKTADQITAEMKDLIGAEYDAGFTEWVWKATQSFLDQHGAEASTSAAASSSSTSIPPTRTREGRQRRSRSPQTSSAASLARENRRSRSPAQSNGRRDEQRRSRSRSPPPSQRREHRMSRDYSSNEAWHKSISTRREEPFDGEAFWRKKAEERRRNPPPPVGAPTGQRAFQNAYDQAVRNSLADTTNSSAERELFPVATQEESAPPPYEQSGGLSIFGRAGIPDPRAAEFVPSSAVQTVTQPAPDTAANGQSIFSRIDPMLPDNQPPPTIAPSHSSDFPSAPTEVSLCRWNVGCTNPMCPYSHASPATTDPNALVLTQQSCRFGSHCNNKECTRSHVSPAVARIQARTAAPVSFTPTAALSMDTALPSQPTSRPCRFGAACTRADCFFDHPTRRTGTPCRFGLGCTREGCYFEHPPGQRATAAAGTRDRLQVFAQAGEGEMEVVIPGAVEGGRERDGSETVKSQASVVFA